MAAMDLFVDIDVQDVLTSISVRLAEIRFLTIGHISSRKLSILLRFFFFCLYILETELSLYLEKDIIFKLPVKSFQSRYSLMADCKIIRFDFLLVYK